MDIEAWLRRLGLEQYAPAFRDNDIDAEVLPRLTPEDLTAVGILSVGHRRKLLDAIAVLPAPAGERATEVTAKRPIDTPISSASSAERRQLTVMFCDLVGSTALASRLDPEDLREVIGAYHRCVAETISRFEGFVAKYMGDGVLAYFGYPSAHEDDAERAVRAGLAVIEALRKILTPETLQVRIGLATGLAVVGDLIGTGAAQEQAVIGETPNLAARLQALAGSDEIVIPENTRRLVGYLFEYENLGDVEVKGLAAPVTSFRVLRESGISSRFEALRTGETPLIGRDEELELLRGRWAQVKAGRGQVVLISAEPGIGKSRLAETFRLSLEGEPHTRLRYFCSPHHQDSALFPFIAQLERAAGFEREDTPTTRLEKLEALVVANAPAEGDVQLAAELLSVPSNDRYPALELTPQRKKEKTFEALLRQLAGLARREPVLMIFEDLHWADPSSRELLDLTVEQIGRLPVLLAATFRPEFQTPWLGQPHVTALSLRRLTWDESEELVRGFVANSAALPSELLNEIIERTDGVPLFLEELTKAVLENVSAGAQISATPFASLAVPATLHASLMARLDRLGSAAKEIAQVGAAIGREFSYELLAATAQRTEAELREAVGRLVDAGLVFQRGQSLEATFLFKHALVQEAAHSTLLRGSRRQLHAHIAEALEAYSPELMDSQPELFAQHYAEAGLVEKSVAFWGNAGQRSVARSAMAEAAAQFQKGLDQLALLPDNPERQRQELEFRSALGSVLMVVKGYAAPETGKAYARARELWEQLGSPLEFLRVPYGPSLYHAVRGEFELALRLDEDLLYLSRRRSGTAGLVLAHQSLGRNLMWTGRFASSRTHSEAGLALYDPISHHSLVHQAGFHPQVVSQAVLGIVLLCLGFPDRALARSSAAIVEARSLVHPPSLAVSLAMGAKLLLLLRDSAVLDEQADQLVAVATEQGFPFYRAQGTIYRSWVKVKYGDVAEGISLLRSGSTAYRATGAKAWMPHQIALVSAASEIAGQIEDAVTQLDDALQIVEGTGERWFAAELNRHKGRLLLRQGHADAAEELYRKARGIAQEQEAKLWELRAAVSLARLYRDQGRPAEARGLLAPIYGWFTEGFDTPDLKEAKALLDELG
jgi:class 3 adenylate cyclase/predicted ATPase